MMTKEEFDELFPLGECCIRADTREQWFAINEYALQRFHLNKSNAYHSHDCATYPFVFCNNRIVDAGEKEWGRMVISFAEFSEIIRKEEDEEGLPLVTLDGVL